ncbi:MAG: alcohol dehydrogenase [Phototrophicales bacterium]|nr:MAG: alcohol dehydrogenase [Phototrophicales bacterium]
MHNLPSTYRKIVITQPSRNFRQVAKIVEEPIPQLAPNQILVKNYYAGVNASDLNISAGIYFVGSEPPWDTGVEATGEVVAVGENVTNFKVGDHVLTTMLGGGYREYYAIDAAMAIPIPQASAEITAVSIGALTASMALSIGGQMTTGETVLITAAAGGVGHFAVQIAKQAGNHVIGTCSSKEKAELLYELGCDRVVVYTEEDLGEALSKEYSQGVDLVLEGVGGETFDAAVDNIAVRGRIVVIGFVSEYKGNPIEVTQPRIYHKLLWKSAGVRGFLFSDYVGDIPEHMGHVITLFAEGKLKAIVDPTEFVGLESVPDAVEHLHAGRNKGKIVVRIQ